MTPAGQAIEQAIVSATKLLGTSTFGEICRVAGVPINHRTRSVFNEMVFRKTVIEIPRPGLLALYQVRS